MPDIWVETHDSSPIKEGEREGEFVVCVYVCTHDSSPTKALVNHVEHMKRYRKCCRLLSIFVKDLVFVFKGCTQGGETACCKEELSNELNTIKERYDGLEKELDHNNQLLVVSKERYDSLEREFRLLKEDRDLLHQMVSESSQKLALVTDQKENVLKDWNTEVQRRSNLEEEIKEFSVAFASRQRSLMSFQSDIKSKCEKLRAQCLVSVPKSLGC
jgi:DNA repair exonuclease SbcCD ATPase subunit